MLCMRGHVSAGCFRCDVLLLHGKHDGFRIILLQEHKANFLIATKF